MVFYYYRINFFTREENIMTHISHITHSYHSTKVGATHITHTTTHVTHISHTYHISHVYHPLIIHHHTFSHPLWFLTGYVMGSNNEYHNYISGWIGVTLFIIFIILALVFFKSRKRW